MADWHALVRERLADAVLHPADEIDIVEELAQHMEDRYRDLCAAGLSESDAQRQSLQEIESHAFHDIGSSRPDGRKNDRLR